MRILIITQNDIFYLPDAISYLIKNISDDDEVVAAVISSVSPFGKKESMLQKALKTYQVFGIIFFLRYLYVYIKKKISGRDVLEVLKEVSVPILDLENQSLNSNASIDAMKSYKPELIVSIAGNEIFKQQLISLAPNGLLNLHTALLPKYRGLMPSFWVLKNNEKKTGVSVFFVDEGIDSGPILVQNEIDINSMPLETLIKKTKIMGMDAILEAVAKIRSGDIDTIPNPDSEKTYYSFPKKYDVRQFRMSGKKFF